MSRVRVCLLADALHDVPPRGLARYTRGLCTALLESGTIDLELITHDPADVDPAGLGERLQTGGDIHAVAENVVFLGQSRRRG